VTRQEPRDRVTERSDDILVTVATAADWINGIRFLEWGGDSCKHVGCGVRSAASHMDARGAYLVVKRIILPPCSALVKNAWIILPVLSTSSWCDV